MADGARRALALLACAAGALHPLAQAQPARSGDLVRVERQRAEATAEAERLRRQQRETQSQIRSLRARLVEAGRRRAVAEQAAAEAEQQVLDLRAQREADGALVLQDRNSLESLLIAAAFAQRGQGRDALRARMLTQGAAPDVSARIGATQRSIQTSERTETAIAIQQANLAAAQLEIDAEKVRTEQLIAEQRALGASLQTDLARAQERAARLGREARSLRELAARATAPARPRAAAPRGGIVPASWVAPASGRMVQAFGARRGAGQPAQGVTLRLRAGGQVISPASGTVDFAGPFRGYGNVLILNAGDGYAIVLAGLGSLRARTGETLVRGQPVGDMPATADSSDIPAPELYVEVRRDGQPIDPGGWLSARGAILASAQ